MRKPSKRGHVVPGAPRGVPIYAPDMNVPRDPSMIPRRPVPNPVPGVFTTRFTRRGRLTRASPGACVSCLLRDGRVNLLHLAPLPINQPRRSEKQSDGNPLAKPFNASFTPPRTAISFAVIVDVEGSAKRREGD